MSAAVGIAIFVKTPGHSPIKTRLAAGIGREAAETFHRLAAAAVAEVAMRTHSPATPVTAYWAVAEEAAMSSTLWQGLPRLAQGDGDLGARMARVHDTLRLRHGRAVLIGADAPQLTADDLRTAATALDTHAATLGPSVDGGFWLFGSREQVPAAAWRDTPWSQADTAERFVAALGGMSMATLRTLRDVDDASDLPLLVEALAALNSPMPTQQALLDWLRTQGVAPR